MKFKSKFPFIVLALIGGFLIIACGGHNKIEVSNENVSSSIKEDDPVLKVFLENSGSMDGYMCDGSQLKDALYDYVSDLNRNSDTTRLYYINSQIIPYENNLTSYIKDLTPESFRIAGGNTSSTDLGGIIGTVLNTVNDTTVSIFVSDCILDLPAKDAVKFLTYCQIQIKTEIINVRKRVPDLGVEILKLSSDFNGKYFYPNGDVEYLKDVKRPYYIWIFGDKNYLAKLNSEVSLSILDNYGLEGMVTFANESSIPYEIKNRNLTNQTITPDKGDYKATILADFRSTLQPHDVVENKNNYKLSNSNLIIDTIHPISDNNNPYTHFITLTIPKGTQIIQDCLVFEIPSLPSWISESNDETGRNISNNLSQTTGIKYLIQGVADAYKDEKVSAKMKFNVKRK